jgi:chromosome partitioning protein
VSRVIAIANQKGGVGKTTTCVNLAASLASGGRAVMLLDLDPQGNATQGLGVDKRRLERTTYEVLLGEAPLEQALQRPLDGHLHLLPANGDLTAAEVQILSLHGKEGRLRTALAPLRERYDYILIDCPPALNMLTVNALSASDSVLIPVQCEYYALEGLSALLQTIETLRARANPALEIEGLLRTMFDPRSRLATEVARQLLEHFGERVFRTVIPRNVRLAEAPSHGLPALLYDRQSRGAIAYLALAGELEKRRNAADSMRNRALASSREKGVSSHDDSP